MKTLLIGLFISALALPALAQTVVPAVPGQPIVSDSMVRNISPAVRPMGTGFYRRPGDPRDVVRARLDNMPIKTPDPNLEYTMLNPQQGSQYRYSLPLPDSLRLRFRRQR